MNIPSVLMQLLEAGHPVQDLLAAGSQGFAGRAGHDGGAFAFVLAQETAPSIANALGQPVLVLPDGGLLLEFELSSIPAGAVVVPPHESQAHNGVSDAGESTLEEAASSEEAAQDAQVLPVVPSQTLPADLHASATLVREGADTVDESDALVPWHSRSSAAYAVAGRTVGTAESLANAQTMPPAPEQHAASAEQGPAVQVVASAENSSVPGTDAVALETVGNGHGPAGGTASEATSASRSPGVLVKSTDEVPPGSTRGSPNSLGQTGAISDEARAAASAAATPMGGRAYGHTVREAALALSGPPIGPDPEGHPVLAAVAAMVGKRVGPGAEGVSVDNAAVAEHAQGSLPAGKPAPETPPAMTVGASQMAEDGQGAQQGGESGDGASSHSNDAPAPKTGELVARYVTMNKHVPEAPAAAHPPELPQGVQPVSTAVTGAEPASPAPGTPAQTSASNTPGEVVEYHIPREAAFRDSMTDLAVRSVRYLVAEGERSLRVRLVPESLGEVRVEIVSTRNELHLRFVSNSPSVRDAMESGSEGLRNALLRDGVNVVRVTVTADGGPSQGHGSLTGRGHWSDGHTTYRYAGPSHEAYGGSEAAASASLMRNAYHEGVLSVYA